jgi:hypothetical protein
MPTHSRSGTDRHATASSVVAIVIMTCLTLTGDPFLVRTDGSTPPDRPHYVSCTLKSVPLRKALAEIYKGSGYDYSVDPNVPDVKVTLQIDKLPLHSAIRRLVRIVQKQVPRFHVDMDTQLFVYKVRKR